MNTRIAALVLSPFVLFMLISGASAQAQRTFVSGSGSDSNPCNRTAPCRTFTQALMGTSAGGEVVVLDSAGYGPFTITQAVSIIAPQGVYAGISVFSGDGIDINAGGQDTVILRGLTINNQGGNGSGILFNTGGTLHVESCVVNGFSTGNGIRFVGAGTLEVKDSILRGNNAGIFVQTSSGTAVAAIDQTRLERNSFGLFAADNARVTVRNSIASANLFRGFAAESLATAPVELNIETCVASNNIEAGIAGSSSLTGLAIIRVSNSTVTDNGTGIDNVPFPGAVILSRGNNTVEGNGTNISGPVGSYSAK